MPKGIFKRKPFTTKHKKKISEHHKNTKGFGKWMAGKKLSEKWRKNISKGMTGEKHWNWKGGIDLENRRIRRSLEYIIWQQKVFKKDYWTCRLCGYKGKDIVAHHLKLFSEFPELRFSIDNGITVCRSCHKKIHKDIGENTKFQKK